MLNKVVLSNFELKFYLNHKYSCIKLLSVVRGKHEIDHTSEELASFPFDESDEVEMIYDHRKNNSGRPEGNFDVFWQEMDMMLEEYGKAAEERRKSHVAHLPLAVPVPQLIKKVCYFVCF